MKAGHHLMSLCPICFWGLTLTHPGSVATSHQEGADAKMNPDRHTLHCYLSTEARRAWQSFSEEQGVSVTSLLEVLGLNIAQELRDEALTRERTEWVAASRKVDAQRRRRG